MISAEQKRSYSELGFLRFRIDDDLVSSAVDEIRHRFDTCGRICNAWNDCPSVRGIALHPSVLAILQSLYGERPRPFQTLNFKFPTQQPTHTDSVHFSSAEREKMCGVWVALEDVDMENGPLMYYPGLHNMWELTDLDGFDSYKDWEVMLGEVLKDHQPEYGIMKKGDGIIWSANFLHGGSPAIDSGRTRWSQATHYYFGEGPFCSPLREMQGKEKWSSQIGWIAEPSGIGCHIEGDKAYHAGDLVKARELWRQGVEFGNEQCAINLDNLGNA